MRPEAGVACRLAFERYDERRDRERQLFPGDIDDPKERVMRVVQFLAYLFIGYGLLGGKKYSGIVKTMNGFIMVCETRHRRDLAGESTPPARICKGLSFMRLRRQAPLNMDAFAVSQ